MSAVQLEAQLGITYKTAWLLAQKLRRSMIDDAQDRPRKAGYIASPLAGLPVSLKDLFNVSGERTLAGSKALGDSPPAVHDAPVVSRLRAAGAILIGRTNMTEFAFSGVGINPHYGT